MCSIVRCQYLAPPTANGCKPDRWTPPHRRAPSRTTPAKSGATPRATPSTPPSRPNARRSGPYRAPHPAACTGYSRFTKHVPGPATPKSGWLTSNRTCWIATRVARLVRQDTEVRRRNGSRAATPGRAHKSFGFAVLGPTPASGLTHPPAGSSASQAVSEFSRLRVGRLPRDTTLGVAMAFPVARWGARLRGRAVQLGGLRVGRFRSAH